MGTLDLGRAGTQTSKVVLDFGGPINFSSTSFGATLFGGPDSTTAQILAAVKEYAHGYWVCTGSDTGSVAEVAIGTNNSTGGYVTSANGQAWAGMVNDFGSWLSTVAYGSQVLAAGANDVEPGFGNPGPVRSWVSGYDGAHSYRMLNYGSADGCPTNHIPSSTECGTSTYPSWGPEDIYYVSWGALSAYPLPEIYTTNGSQAQQWYWLSRYAVQSHGTPMYYVGSFTQWRACKTRSCFGTNNTPATGYTQLYNALQQDSSTAQTPCCASENGTGTRGRDGGRGSRGRMMNMAGTTAHGPAKARLTGRRWGIAVLAGLVVATAGASLAWSAGAFDRERGAKAADAARMQELNRQQIAGAPRAEKGDPAAEAPAPAGPIRWDQGVFRTREAPIPAGVLVVTSMWGQTIGSSNYSVYAGASASDPTQGLLVVQRYTLWGAHLGDRDYSTPVRSGSVRIVSARGHRLRLVSETGRTFVFDFNSRRFV